MLYTCITYKELKAYLEKLDVQQMAQPSYHWAGQS